MLGETYWEVDLILTLILLKEPELSCAVKRLLLLKVLKAKQGDQCQDLHIRL
jgi:hypothetical protein